jgi:hypothetical protein
MTAAWHVDSRHSELVQIEAVLGDPPKGGVP